MVLRGGLAEGAAESPVARWAKAQPKLGLPARDRRPIPCIKLGGLLRFDPEAVKKFFLSGGAAERKVIA